MNQQESKTAILVNGAPVDYRALPESARGGMKRYIEHGIMPGNFLSAVLSNDLMATVSRADDVNRTLLQTYCSWLYCYAPPASFGSVEKVKAWVESQS